MKKANIIILVAGIIPMLFTCQKLDFDPVTKVKTTSAISGLNYIQAECEIVELSDKNHLEFGFFYGTNQYPTENDSKSVIGAPEKGVFTDVVSGLLPDTKYFIRAYCSEGDSYKYGEVAEVKTSIETLTDIDNNTYNAIKIGTQIWMQENLSVTHYRNGDAIANVTDNGTWSNLSSGACCWYDNDNDNREIYGAMYNYYAVVDGRELCPTGWHIPSDAEWTILSEYLGGDEVAGGKMKAFGLTHWLKPNTDATNSSGFTAFPGGYREFDGAFNSLGIEGKWWSTTTYDATTSMMCYIYNNYSTLFRENFNIINGLSVRCVKD